ncbi:hypothetical protein X772_32690 [Mesorhizobium sp. LSJC280B00]|nr:hypothetical protein X772_32690 [Mesorhizobium sp. LSJC280B00]
MASCMMVKRKHIALSDLIPDQMATVCTKQANAAISLLSKKRCAFIRLFNKAQKERPNEGLHLKTTRVE